MSKISSSLPPPWPNQALALSKEASQIDATEVLQRSAEAAVQTRSGGVGVSGAAAATEVAAVPGIGSGGGKVNVVT